MEVSNVVLNILVDDEVWMTSLSDINVSDVLVAVMTDLLRYWYWSIAGSVCHVLPNSQTDFFFQKKLRIFSKDKNTNFFQVI